MAQGRFWLGEERDVMNVIRWFEARFELMHGLLEVSSTRSGFARVAAGDKAPAAAASLLPAADQPLPEAVFDKHVAEMLGTLKSSTYLEGHYDNNCPSSPDFGALIEAHHGTSFVRGSVSAPSSDLVALGRKDDLDAGLGSISAGAFILDDGDGNAGHRLDEDFIIPLGDLPPVDLGPPPVI